MRVSRKLPAIFAGLVLLCCIGIGGSSYFIGTNLVRSEAERRLMAVAENRKNVLIAELNGLGTTLLNDAQSEQTLAALSDFETGWRRLGTRAASTLKKAYAAANPHSKETVAVSTVAGSLAYDRAHQAHDSALRTRARELGIQDLLLVNTEGRIVYTLGKLSDFGADLRSAELSGSNVALAFEKAIEGEADRAHYFDLQSYSAHAGQPTSFISAPVYSDGQAFGALIYHVPTGALNTLLGDYADLGRTGNVFFVNEHGLVQNDSLRTPQKSELLYSSLSRNEVTPLLGKTQANISLPDFQGADVEAAVAPFQFLGRDYAVVVTQDTAEIEAPLALLRDMILGMAAFSMFAAAATGTVIARRLTSRVSSLSEAMRQLADGDTSIELRPGARNDEFDDLMEAVALLRANEIRRQELEIDRWTEDERYDVQATRMKALVDKFIADVSAA